MNRTQKYLLNKFNIDLSDVEFDNLKFLIEKYFYYKTNKQNDSVWNDLTIYKESLNHLSIQLSRIYFRLCYTYSDNNNLELWRKNEQEWRDYHKSIELMCFNTKESIDLEIKRIKIEYNKAIELENLLKEELNRI